MNISLRDIAWQSGRTAAENALAANGPKTESGAVHPSEGRRSFFSENMFRHWKYKWPTDPHLQSLVSAVFYRLQVCERHASRKRLLQAPGARVEEWPGTISTRAWLLLRRCMLARGQRGQSTPILGHRNRTMQNETDKVQCSRTASLP